MKEPHVKGVAVLYHYDPESCAGNREATREALTGENAGHQSGVTTSYNDREGNTV